MDPGIIAVVNNVLYAIVCIVVFFISVWFGRNKESILADKLDVYNLQLQYVYEPLHQLFLFAHEPKQAMEQLDEIIMESVSLVPPSIEENYVLLKKKKPEDLTKDDFTRIKKIVAADYNRIRCKLGLPYNKDKINLMYCSYGLTPQTFREFGFYTLYALTAIVVLNIFGAIFSTGYAFSLTSPFTLFPLLVLGGYAVGTLAVRIRF